MSTDNYEIAIQDISKKIKDFISLDIQNDDKYIQLYNDYEDPFNTIFAYLHYELNILINFINKKKDSQVRSEINNPNYPKTFELYYNAEQSRKLIKVILFIRNIKDVSKGKFVINLDNKYQNVLDYMSPQLKESCGSEIYGDYKKVEIEEYKQIFTLQPLNSFGNIKNIIFASSRYKPEIIITDALENNIEIVKNGEYCLVYDLPIVNSTLTLGTLKTWWENKGNNENLFERLLKSGMNEIESRFFNVYYNTFYNNYNDDLPALIPQVYLHYDPKTLKELRDQKRLLHQRMDFLILYNGHRIIIELDGKQHYSDNDKSSPSKYAELVSYDRKMHLLGYEVFRFGGNEFHQNEINNDFIIDFFIKLFDKIGYQIKEQTT